MFHLFFFYRFSLPLRLLSLKVFVISRNNHLSNIPFNNFSMVHAIYSRGLVISSSDISSPGYLEAKIRIFYILFSYIPVSLIKTSDIPKFRLSRTKFYGPNRFEIKSLPFPLYQSTLPILSLPPLNSSQTFLPTYFYRFSFTHKPRLAQTPSLDENLARPPSFHLLSPLAIEMNGPHTSLSIKQCLFPMWSALEPRLFVATLHN